MSQEPNTTEPDSSVHRVLTEVLRHTFERAVIENLDWSDLADEFVIALGGRVVCIMNADYEYLVDGKVAEAKARHTALPQEAPAS